MNPGPISLKATALATRAWLAPRATAQPTAESL